MIRLYVKVPKVLKHLILQDRCWVVHIPFLRMVKFNFLAQFPVDNIAHPVKSIIIFIFYRLEFFSSALADGLSLEFERQQVSSSLQDYTQYSGRSQ